MVKLINVSVARNILITLLLFSTAVCASARANGGTYSTLMYNEESGDMNGMEMTFIPTYDELFAVVQIAEGFNEVHLAKVQINADSVLFSIQLNDGSSASFALKCTPKSCKGEYVSENGHEKIVLPKSNGYWNKR